MVNDILDDLLNIAAACNCREVVGNISHNIDRYRNTFFIGIRVASVVIIAYCRNRFVVLNKVIDVDNLRCSILVNIRKFFIACIIAYIACRMVNNILNDLLNLCSISDG